MQELVQFCKIFVELSAVAVVLAVLSTNSLCIFNVQIGTRLYSTHCDAGMAFKLARHYLSALFFILLKCTSHRTNKLDKLIPDPF